MASTKQLANTENMKLRWLFTLGSVAALVLLALFLIGIASISAAGSQQSAASSWPASIQDNWLIVLFKLNVSSGGAQTDLLSVLNLTDIVIMALSGVMFLSLYAALYRTSRIWSVIAASLPFLGIMVFLITHTAGRSGLLIGALIFSTVMLGSNAFNRISAYVGLMAGALLFFAGDIGTTFFSPSGIIAILIGIGYVLWVIWFFIVGRRLFQLGSGRSKAKS